MIRIRNYRPDDKPHIQEICRVTAHPRYKKTAASFAAVTLLYNDYYTEQEPENVLVAVGDNDLPVGYILCSADNKKFLREMKKTYEQELKRVFPSGRAEAIAARLLSVLLPPKYRVHLHIDILPEYQRMGIGSKLVDAMRAHLASEGVPYLTVLSVSTGSDGYRFYKKYGFRILRHWIPGEVAFTIPTK